MSRKPQGYNLFDYNSL